MDSCTQSIKETIKYLASCRIMTIDMDKKFFFYSMKSIIQYSWSWQHLCETQQDLLLSHILVGRIKS